MKFSSFLLLPSALALFLVAAAVPAAFAQETTTTTVVQPAPPIVVQPTPAVTEVPTQTQTTVTATSPVHTQATTVITVPAATAPVALQPGQHLAEIELVLTHGSVEAYFGEAPRGEKFSLGDASIRVKLPSTATVTKLASRDKASEGAKRVTPDNPWHVTVPFSDTGRFVFNIVEWDDDPVVAVALVKIDGVIVFEGHGSEENISDWPQKTFGVGVHKTGSREVAFEVQ